MNYLELKALKPFLRDHALLCQETNHTCNNGRDADGCGNREQDALGVVLQAAEELVEVGLAIAVTRLARLSGLGAGFGGRFGGLGRLSGGLARFGRLSGRFTWLGRLLVKQAFV